MAAVSGFWIAILMTIVKFSSAADYGVEDNKNLDIAVQFKVLNTLESAATEGFSSLVDTSTPMMVLHAIPAHFGAHIPRYGIFGNLTHPETRHDCEQFPPGDILLTWLGSCSDPEQVAEAAGKGIKAMVLIASNFDVVDSFRLRNVTIPVMFMLELDSILLWDVWHAHPGRMVEMKLDTSKYDDRRRDMIIFWSCLSAFVVTYLSFVHLRRWTKRRAIDANYRKLMAALPKRSVDETPTDDNDCAVCQEDYVRGDKVLMLLPCRHEFHTKCIDSWLKRDAPDCPKCRQGIDVTNTNYGAI